MHTKGRRFPFPSSLLLLFPVRKSRAQRLSSTAVYPAHRRVAHKQTTRFLGGGTTDTLLKVRRQHAHMRTDNLYQLPANLPVPVDDGAARHLPGLALPSIALPSTGGGSVRLDDAAISLAAVYCYP